MNIVSFNEELNLLNNELNSLSEIVKNYKKRKMIKILNYCKKTLIRKYAILKTE